MPTNISATDKRKIERFLRHDPHLHLFALGDLDEPYWSKTEWYWLMDGSDLRQLAVLYTGASEPYLMALTRTDIAAMGMLLEGIVEVLPQQFTATVHPGMVKGLRALYRISTRATYAQMALLRPDIVNEVNTNEVEPIGPEQRDELEVFYQEAYQNHHYYPELLATRQFFGVRRGGRLVGAGGVHLFAPKVRVAALGHVATHPDYRRQGIATRVTARICQSVLQHADTVGLLVEADNRAAIRCYEQLGFVRHNPVEVARLSRRIAR